MILLTTLISSCGPKYIVYNRECIWYEPTKMPAEVKDWIRTQNPPPSLKPYLDKVILNNKLFNKNCPDH